MTKFTRRKLSINMGGHKTSVVLEEQFWDGLNKMAKLRNVTVIKLIREMAQMNAGQTNLHSFIRVAVLQHFMITRDPNGS